MQTLLNFLDAPPVQDTREETRQRVYRWMVKQEEPRYAGDVVAALGIPAKLAVELLAELHSISWLYYENGAWSVV